MRHYILILMVYVTTMNLSAYETETHAVITREAINISILERDPALLFNLGLDSDLHKSVLPATVPADPGGRDPDRTLYRIHTSIAGIIMAGAVLEDAGSRSIHHFLDPHNGETGGMTGLPSHDWILESIRQADGVELPVTLAKQQYSYNDALDYFYLALTTSGKEEENINFSLFFRSIGHVIHHIQDMAQPQHVRNDDHCDATVNFPGVAFVCFLVGRHNPSYFEKYTNRRINFLTFNPGKTSIPGFPGPRDYWVNEHGSGLAEFTEKNFVSDGTNYQGINLNTLSPHPSFPLPVPLADLVSVPLSELLQDDPFLIPARKSDLLTRLGCNTHGDCLMDFVQNTFEIQSVRNERSSTLSIFDDEIRSRNLEITNTFLSTYKTKRLTTLNRFNFEAVYPYLLPRAVSYSAGLIDHFFRGRLHVDGIEWFHNDSLRITVSNDSPDINVFGPGEFELLYDSGDGARLKLGFLEPVPDKLLPGESVELTGMQPDEIKPGSDATFFLLYRGNIGRSPGIAATRIPQPPVGSVSEIRELSLCPGKVEFVKIVFEDRPPNAGMVIITGKDSNWVYDFRDVPRGTTAIKHSIVGWHDQEDDLYVYRLMFDPEAKRRLLESSDSGFENICRLFFAGLWQPGEKVLPILSENPEIDNPPEF